MDVLMLSPLPPPSGGIASWTNSFIAYCKKKDVSVRIVDISVRGKRAECEVLRRNYLDEVNRSISIFRNLRKEIKERKPSIMHINTSCARFGVIRDAICLKYGLNKDIPVVLHCHCNIEDQLQGKLAKKVFSWMIKKASQTIVLNEKSLKYAHDANGKNISILPNFIADENVALTHCINEKISTVLYVGHIEYAKGVSEILKVAEVIPNIQFVLVGPVREDISILGKPDNVIITGKVGHEEVKRYLSEADLFLFLSHSEGFSIALLEAMAAGIPVIATDVGANRSMIEDMGGVIVGTGEHDSIPQIIEYMQPAEIRERMSKWNIEKVKKDYLGEYVLSNLLNMYVNLGNV